MKRIARTIAALAAAGLLGTVATTAQAEEGPMHHMKGGAPDAQAPAQTPAPAQAPDTLNPGKPTSANTPENNAPGHDVTGKGADKGKEAGSSTV